jgi:hypothetical protein
VISRLNLAGTSRFTGVSGARRRAPSSTPRVARYRCRGRRLGGGRHAVAVYGVAGQGRGAGRLHPRQRASAGFRQVETVAS